MLRRSNPTQREDIFGPSQSWEDVEGPGSIAAAPTKAKPANAGRMTIGGTVNKSMFLLAICVITAVVAWDMTVPEPSGQTFGITSAPVSPMGVTFGGAILGFLIAMVTIFKPKLAMWTAPLYALCEGCFVGGISGVYAMYFAKPGAEGMLADSTIVIQAALGTFGVFAASLVAYRTGLIKPTKRLRSFVVIALGGLILTTFGSMMLSMFFDMPFIQGAHPLGLVITLFAIGLAALSFIFDFDFIEQGVANGVGKWGEWYGGFSLLVTLVWVYVEMLRLIWIIRSMADD